MDVSAHVVMQMICLGISVIFLRNNYYFDIPAVANALSKRYREIICKPCHKQLKDGKYSSNVQNCGNSNLFGSNVTYEQNDQDST